MDNRIEILEEQKNFYRSGTDYVHKWRRQLTYQLLRQFQSKLINDEATLNRLLRERAELQNQLSGTFQSLQITQKGEQEAKVSAEALKKELETAQHQAQIKLNDEIATREKEKEEQIKGFDDAKAMYDSQIAEYKAKAEKLALENQKLSMISINAVKYITEPTNINAFYGWLASKEIIMDYKVFKELTQSLHTMTSDQLLLSMSEGALALLDNLDLPPAEETPLTA